MYNILLVEDDLHIREAIMDYFSEKGSDSMILYSAIDGNRGLEMIYEQEFDLILLDIMLPGLDGFSLCREIRRKSTVPIIFLTAKAREQDVLYGYDLGCDDYMIKPFSLAELFVKVVAMLKRAKGLVGANLLTCGDISLNPATYVVLVSEHEVKLPPKEYTLLKYLLERKNKVIDRETLLVNIWGYDFDGSDRVVDNHIKKLRKALGTSGSRIKTIISKGYKISED
ncbi:MAG: response regulator transcription factor [Clostridium sp.]|nr:response regulator transcription factor [Clostridium sp.]MCM1171623.1 response regulator transcription factor [Clostridium sp.]MCM1207882.1 response regulator transcription factor [Ruminococcus sp.]